jgi:hypothetical protein
MVEKEFAPVTPGEMLKRNSCRVWPVAKSTCEGDQNLPKPNRRDRQ